MSEEDRDLNTSIGMFEAAVRARPIDLQEPKIEVVVAALDGSNQDESTRLLAQALAQATGARHHEHTSAEKASDILALAEEKNASLVVVPAPFGRDISELKDESLGSVVDMLLQEANCPVLCVRQPLDEPTVNALLADVLVPVLDHDGDHTLAASWALQIVAENGRMELLGVADKDLLDEAKKILGDAIDPNILRAEALNRAVAADIGGLVAAAQKRGAEQRINIYVETKVGRPIQIVLEEANRRPRLIIVDHVADHTSPAYHHAADLVLGATGPVLVV